MSEPVVEAGYSVMVDANAHYMDADERYRLGVYPTYEAALAACRSVVATSLAEVYEPGLSAAELLMRYKSFGADPFVAEPTGVVSRPRFSAWEYARQEAERMCRPS